MWTKNGWKPSTGGYIGSGMLAKARGKVQKRAHEALESRYEETVEHYRPVFDKFGRQINKALKPRRK